MPGRLNSVDLDTDLVLVVLLFNGGQAEIDTLYTQLETVETDAFPFTNDLRSVESYVEALHMFESIHHVEKQDTEIHLTDIGKRMAEHLDLTLTADQRNALLTATHRQKDT